MAEGSPGIENAAQETRQWLQTPATEICSHEEKLIETLSVRKTPAVALVGLHTCGDLAASTLRLFSTSDLFSALILTPCCYHKMKMIQVGKKFVT